MIHYQGMDSQIISESSGITNLVKQLQLNLTNIIFTNIHNLQQTWSLT